MYACTCIYMYMYLYIYLHIVHEETEMVLGKYLFSLHNGVAELRVKDTAQPPFLISWVGKKERVVLPYPYSISSSQPRNASRAGDASMNLPDRIKPWIYRYIPVYTRINPNDSSLGFRASPQQNDFYIYTYIILYVCVCVYMRLFANLTGPSGREGGRERRREGASEGERARESLWSGQEQP